MSPRDFQKTTHTLGPFMKPDSDSVTPKFHNQLLIPCPPALLHRGFIPRLHLGAFVDVSVSIALHSSLAFFSSSSEL